MAMLVMAEERETLGARIRRLRRAQELSQQDLAHAAGINLSNVYQIESGKIADPRLSTIRGIAYALSIDLLKLLDGVVQAAPVPRRKKTPKSPDSPEESPQ